ncbi:MAG TPA: DUF3108 domain-containing protein [Thauera sp.]|nr:DUF3108 domain-containing protein [Thauera sp.]
MRFRDALRKLLVLAMWLMPFGYAVGAELTSVGSMRFDVYYGTQGLKVGEARHDWRIGPDSYELNLNLEAKGLASLFGLQYEQHSSGTVGSAGLRPDVFVVDQRRRKRESAHFDWPAARVSLRRDGKERRSGTISSGDQDVLSLWHQVRRFARSEQPVALNVVTGKSIKRASVRVLGRELLKLPLGEVETLRMQAQAEGGELDIDIWLSLQHDLLPVRIRITDDEGSVLDQRATMIDPERKPGSITTEKN